MTKKTAVKMSSSKSPELGSKALCDKLRKELDQAEAAEDEMLGDTVDAYSLDNIQAEVFHAQNANTEKRAEKAYLKAAKMARGFADDCEAAIKTLPEVFASHANAERARAELHRARDAYIKATGQYYYI